MTAYQNIGELFYEDRLEVISEFPEWGSARIEEARRKLEELYEKREAMLGEPSRSETSYYWTSYVLRRLGFCFSVAEMSPVDTDVRPDFALFYDAEEFLRAKPYRGEREFFSRSLGVLKSLGWHEELDTVNEETGSTAAIELDRFIRDTGVTWGILTNGREWRLYHRDTSGLLNSYYQVNLVDALMSNQLDDFKYFWMVFTPEGMGDLSYGDTVINRLRQ